eukprot:CAMPEP_0197028440 /NCGR_PEP_ID=MMETSP1384-20130603/8126_1 /TAXON_ID=29189 /ORGANISM="Ammonia sp." /LENGTH=234 /DNA_ID=CAMNT_0042457445 /DNA_START=76 /DNA_END=780 /DNA_ORIENTATION=-
MSNKKGQIIGGVIGGVALAGVAALTGAAMAQDLKHEKEAKRELHKHKDLVEQKKQYDEHGQILYYNPVLTQNIALLGFHNQYLSAFKNSSLEVKAEKVGGNEVFTTVPLLQGVDNQKDARCKVAIKPVGTELYLRCDKHGNLNLEQHCKEWEEWLVEKDEKSGMFSFKSAYWNTYLSAQSNGKPVADRKKVGDWEKWRVIMVQLKHDKQQEPVSQSNQPKKQQTKMAENDGSYY